jgi:hypothetical protein
MLPDKIMNQRKGRKMSAISALTASSRAESVIEAARVLAGCDVSHLASLIVRRLEGGIIAELPGVVRDEEPRSVFIELAAVNPQLCESLQRAVVQLLDHIASQSVFEKPNVAGEICCLCTLLDASRGIDPLAKLVSRDDTALALLPDGEDLRLRALRSLVGLLGDRHATQPEASLATVFEHLLGDPKCGLLSLTALVGLWPERRSEFVRRSLLSPSDESRLDISLRWAGFISEAAQLKGQSSRA